MTEKIKSPNNLSIFQSLFPQHVTLVKVPLHTLRHCLFETMCHVFEGKLRGSFPLSTTCENDNFVHLIGLSALLLHCLVHSKCLHTGGFKF